MPRTRSGSVLQCSSVAAMPVFGCTGCEMLGALFDAHVLLGIVLVVAAIVAVGFIVSRAARR